MKTQYINLNMTPSGVNPIFHISQYDVGRVLGFYVYNGSEVVDLDDYTCTIEATRTDGTQITTNVITNNNSGIFAVTATMSNVADKYNCQLVIVGGNSARIASIPFVMDVATAALNGNDSSIYDDRSLYQQYNAATQAALANEANIRENADTILQNNIKSEASARQKADNALQSNINALQSNIKSEASARQKADNALQSNINALQSNINSEASARASADSNLQAQINHIIAPSGEAPSAAEVQNARIGANGATYDTLGTAIRTQVNDINEDLSSVIYPCVKISNNDAKVLKRIHISAGAKFRIETLDGKDFGVTTTLRVCDPDGKEFDYYSIFEGATYRDIINDTGRDIYYVMLNDKLGINDFRVVVYIADTLFARVDKLESNALQNTNGYPAFYDSYIADRIETVKSKDLLIGNSGDSFVFITDMHNENNYYSPFLAKKIYDSTSVKRIIYGGDYENEPSSKESAVSLLTTRRNKCMVKDDVIFLRGNHDTNPYGTGQLTVGEFYSIFDKHIEKYINTNKNTYFYNDNESQKIRYIFVDSGVDGSISDVQKNWVKINTENLNNDWTVIVFMHQGIYTDNKDDRTNIKVYPSLTSVKEALANVSCKIACIICGHTHIDLSDTSGKYPIICTTCDAHGIQASSMSSDNRNADTINEQAFDVFHIDTANKKVYVTRIGGGKNDVRENKNFSLNDREFSYS